MQSTLGRQMKRKRSRQLRAGPIVLIHELCAQPIDAHDPPFPLLSGHDGSKARGIALSHRLLNPTKKAGVQPAGITRLSAICENRV